MYAVNISYRVMSRGVRKMIAFICLLSLLIPYIPAKGAGIDSVGDGSVSIIKADGCLRVTSYNASKNAPEYAVKIACMYMGSEEKYKFTHIDDRVFEGKTLTQVYLEGTSGLTIGKRAFQSAKVTAMTGSSITTHKVEITGNDSGGGVYDAGEYAFSAMQVDGDFAIHFSNGKIGTGAFRNAKIGGTLYLYGSIDTLGDYALAGASMEKMWTSYKICHIGEGAFQKTPITNYKLGDCLETLGSKVFDGCENLREIVLPENGNIKTVAEDAFPDKEGLTIVIPDEQTDLSIYHFDNYEKLTFQTDENIAEDSPVLQYLTEKGLTYKMGAEGSIVKPIPSASASPSPSITPSPSPSAAPSPSPSAEPSPSITPSSSPSAEPSPSVVPSPSAVPSLSPGVRPGVSPGVTPKASLVPTKKPSMAPTKKPVAKKRYTVKKIKYQITGKNIVMVTGLAGKGKKKLTIPDTVSMNGRLYKVVEIRKKAFKNQKKIQEVVIGNFVKKVGAEAFAKCKKLRKIQFGTRTKSLGKRIFWKDDKLKKIVFKGKKLKVIGKQAFKGVSREVNIIVPRMKAKSYRKLIKRSKK